MLSEKEFNQLKTQLTVKPLDITQKLSNYSQEQQGYLDRVISDYQSAGQNIVNEITGSAEDILKSNSIPQKRKRIIETGIRTVGEVAGATVSPITEAVVPVIHPVIEKIGEIPGVKNGIKFVSDWAEKNPEVAKDLNAVLNIAMLYGGKNIEEPLKSASKKTILKTTEKGLGGISGTGKLLKNIGIKSYGIPISMEKPTAIAQQIYEASKPTLFERIKNLVSDTNIKSKLIKPISEAETAARQGIVGTEWSLGVKAKKTANKLWTTVIQPSLASSKAKNNMKNFFNELRKDIINENADLARRNVLLKAYNSFISNYKKVSNISDLKLQEYKEGWTKFIPEKSYRGEPITGALNEIRDMAANKARNILNERFGPTMKQAYIDYGNLKSIMKSGIKSIDPLRSKSAFKQTWEFIMDKAVAPITTYGGKVLYRTGEGLEFIGNKGAKKVRDILNQ